MKRRGFLGGLAGLLIGTPVLTAKPKDELMVLSVQRCPECGQWNYRPKKPKRSMNKKRYKPIRWECVCGKCGFKETAQIICMVIPKIESPCPAPLPD